MYKYYFISIKIYPCTQIYLHGSIVEGFNVIHIFLEYPEALLPFLRVLVHSAITSHPFLMPLMHGGILESARCDLRSPNCDVEKQCQRNVIELSFGSHGS